jgi:hypothetical protein
MRKCLHCNDIINNTKMTKFCAIECKDQYYKSRRSAFAASQNIIHGTYINVESDVKSSKRSHNQIKPYRSAK